MRNELADLDGVDKLPPTGRTPPGLDIGDSWPRVKRGIDFNGVEALQIVFEPVLLRNLGIERVAPLPVTPAGASDME